MEPRVGMKFTDRIHGGIIRQVLSVKNGQVEYIYISSGEPTITFCHSIKQFKETDWIQVSTKQDTLKWIKSYLETSQSTVSSGTTESLGE